MIPELERKLTELWERRQRLLDAQSEERRQRSAHDAWLDAVRVDVPAWREQQEDVKRRYRDAWQVILDLDAENRDLRTKFRRAEVSPGFDIPGRVVTFVKRERDRLRVFFRGPRDQTSYNRQRAQDLRAFAKEQEKARKVMTGGSGSIDQARSHVEKTRAAADALEGKTPVPAEDNAMFVPLGGRS